MADDDDVHDDVAEEVENGGCSLFCCLCYIVLLVLAYKALDWLIRRLYLGGNAERYVDQLRTKLSVRYKDNSRIEQTSCIHYCIRGLQMNSLPVKFGRLKAGTGI